MNKVGIKTGAWVMTAAGLGIQIIERVFMASDGSKRTANYSEELPKGSTESRETWVHLVNPDGTTYAQIPEQAAGEIRLAKRSEIPALRIAHLTDEQLAAMGYV
jgi:hypothetical protein